MEAVVAPGRARFTAEWMVSTPGARYDAAFAHVSPEFVMIWRPAARSYHALCRMPWWPGWHPVSTVVWLASVTVGIDDIAPQRYAVPSSISRATFGASPLAARS